jgi:hypothetical protein
MNRSFFLQISTFDYTQDRIEDPRHSVESTREFLFIPFDRSLQRIRQNVYTFATSVCGRNQIPIDGE